MHIRTRMTANPFTVTPEATVVETLELMKNHQVRRVPVVENGRLVGIITKSRLLEVSPSPATTLSVYEINTLLAKTKIGKVMTKEVITIGPDNLLEEALVKMRHNNISSLPVLDNDKLIGIITESDIYDAFIEILGFRDPGCRMAIDFGEDRPGIYAKITSIIAGYDILISHIFQYRNEIILRLNTTNVEEVVEAIKAGGYTVTSVIIND